MTHHSNPDHDRARPVSRYKIIDRRERSSPYHGHQQAVRPGIVREVERREARVARIDPHLLPPEQKKEWPQYIQEQWRRDQHRHVAARREFLAGKSHREMAKKHNPEDYTREPCRRQIFSNRRTTTHSPQLCGAPTQSSSGCHASLTITR